MEKRSKLGIDLKETISFCERGMFLFLKTTYLSTHLGRAVRNLVPLDCTITCIWIYWILHTFSFNKHEYKFVYEKVFSWHMLDTICFCNELKAILDNINCEGQIVPFLSLWRPYQCQCYIKRKNLNKEKTWLFSLSPWVENCIVQWLSWYTQMKEGIDPKWQEWEISNCPRSHLLPPLPYRWPLIEEWQHCFETWIDWVL